MSSEKPRLVIVVGPTAAGKSAAALALAERFGGEIVACDSMQVYRGFDIGTDKPPADDRRRVPHHLVDVADPRTQFTAAEFAGRALEAFAAIRSRGRLPIVAGGTGLYLKALLDGLFPGPGRDPDLRRALEGEAAERGTPALHEKLKAADPEYAAVVGPNDKVRIVRALEVLALTGIPLSGHFRRTRGRLEGWRVLRLGLERPRPELRARIEDRVDRMFAAGLVAEVERLLASGVPAEAPAFKGLGYRHVLGHLRGEADLAETILRTKIDTRRYAKRQMTWFRRTPEVAWLPAGDREAILAAAGAWLATEEEETAS